jgi:hypothetical protein
MRPDSQGPALSQKQHTTMTTMIEKKRLAPFKTPSQHKRARLDVSLSQKDKDKENGRDEKALMDDLMAGLDASMFDGIASSPVKSQVVVARDLPVRRQRQGSPMRPSVTMGVKPIRQDIKMERSPLRPTLPLPVNRPIKTNSNLPKAFNEPIIKTEPKRVKAFAPIKIEFEEKVPQPMIQEVKDEKPVLVDEEDEFTFDFNLDELAHMDDDLLMKPHVDAKVRAECEGRGRDNWTDFVVGLSSQESGGTYPAR